MEQDVRKLELLNRELELELDIVKNNLKDKTKMFEEKRIELEETKLELEKTRKELDKILYSRSYKFICKIKKVMGRN